MSGIIAINLVSDRLAGEHNHVKLLCQVKILTVLRNYHIFNNYNGKGGVWTLFVGITKKLQGS